MKRTLKLKHRSPSTEDEGGTSGPSGDAPEEKKALLKVEEEPQSETLSPQKHMASEDGAFELKAETGQHLLDVVQNSPVYEEFDGLFHPFIAESESESQSLLYCEYYEEIEPPASYLTDERVSTPSPHDQSEGCSGPTDLPEIFNAPTSPALLCLSLEESVPFSAPVHQPPSAPFQNVFTQSESPDLDAPSTSAPAPPPAFQEEALGSPLLFDSELQLYEDDVPDTHIIHDLESLHSGWILRPSQPSGSSRFWPPAITQSQDSLVGETGFSRDDFTHASSTSVLASIPQVVSVLQSFPEVAAQGFSEKELGVHHEPPIIMEAFSATKTVPSSSGRGGTGSDNNPLSRTRSVSSLSQIISARNMTLTRAQSLPDMVLKTSFEEFTPVVAVEENNETYSFQCPRPGLYRCSVTGLLFHTDGEGDVVYRTVPWNRRLLAQHHKRPAGPLFDITCVQQCVCQLHLPHCEIRSTGGCHFLSVAHVNDEAVEFIPPHKITETHVVINVTGFSGFGNVKEEDSPPVPVRALVLLFYKPSTDPDLESLINVLMLPKNVSLRDVLRSRKRLTGEERYIETSPHCKLHPDQVYTLSTRPEDDSVLVQPTEAEFDCDNYDNYFPSFQVILEKIMKHIKLVLRDASGSHSVWERRVCLLVTGLKSLNLPSEERLLDIRSSFIDGISEPVLKSLLDKLLEKRVMTDSERETADGIQNKRDKARFVLDTVRKKGEAAGSEMIEFLCEVDPFLCEHLGLI